MISKLVDMRKGEDKGRILKMYSKTRESQTKIISTIDTHIKKKKQSKHDTKDSKSQVKTTKERSKKDPK